jgi:hypothetical protein
MVPAPRHFIDKATTKLAAAHNQAFQNFILFEQFQIALPLDWIGIILRANGHRPGGCQAIPNSEMLP